MTNCFGCCGPTAQDIENSLWETDTPFEKAGPLPEQSGKQLPPKLNKKRWNKPPQRDGVPYGKESNSPAIRVLWYLIALVNQAVIGVIVIPIAVVVTVIFDILDPHMHRSCSCLNFLESLFVRIMGSIRKLLGIPWLIVVYLNGATWIDLLEICLERDYFILTYWLEIRFNPQLYYRSDKAVFVHGRAGLAEKVHSLSGVPAPDKSETSMRKTSMEMIAKFKRERSDKACLELLEKSYRSPDGVDLNWPSPHGYTVIMLAMKKGRKRSLEWLLTKEEVDTDRQDHYSGNTGMHMLVQQIRKVGDKKAASLFEMLVKDKRTNFTILNFHGDLKTRGIASWFRKPSALDFGCTPYMLLPAGNNTYKKSAEVLKPNPSYDDLLSVIQSEIDPKEKCSAIYDLIADSREDGDRSLHHLHVMDMLFCPREGTPEQLGVRRKKIFQYFLKGMILKSTEEHLKKEEVALLRWVYYQSAGPPGMKKDFSRKTYITEFGIMMEEAEERIEQRYGAVYKKITSQEGADELFSIGKTVNYIEPQELKHSTFLKFPDFIRNLNGIQGVRDLYAVGAIQHTGDFCNLLQGRHRLFGDQPIIGLFLSDPNNTGAGKLCFKEEATLWNSLILLWQICLQEKIEDEFNKSMKAIADAVDGVGFMTPPRKPGGSGVKGYLRSYEKTDKDYSKYEPIGACMRVIDGLRCSFIVENVSQNLQVGKLIEETFGVARTKNGHQWDHLSYADRKYNVVFESKTRVPGVDYDINVLCEIQILFQEYFDIKADGHLLYEFGREPEQKQPLNLRSTTRDAMNCVCACGKYWTIVVILMFVAAFILETKNNIKDAAEGCRMIDCTSNCTGIAATASANEVNVLDCATCSIHWTCAEHSSTSTTAETNRAECFYFESPRNASDIFCICGQLAANTSAYTDISFCSWYYYNNPRFTWIVNGNGTRTYFDNGVSSNSTNSTDSVNNSTDSANNSTDSVNNSTDSANNSTTNPSTDSSNSTTNP